MMIACASRHPRRMAVPRRRTALRPTLVVLEDRTVLSPTVYTVTGWGDSPSDPHTATSGNLRYCIDLANANTANPDGSLIQFEPAAFGVPRTIPLTDGLQLSNRSAPITISGTGVSFLTISGGGPSSNFRVLVVVGGVTAKLSGMTITNGHASNGGGGIFNSGTLDLTDLEVSGNSASSDGGGIWNSNGTMTLTDVIIAGNASKGDGGGLASYSGTVNLSRVTISGNSTSNDGGGIHSDSCTMTIDGSTILNNTAIDYGGGIKNFRGTMIINDSTISRNTAITGGGGGLINIISATMTVTGSTISNNTTTYASGGGLLNNLGTVTFSGVSVLGNSARSNGGGVMNESGTATLTRVTISDNSSESGDGGGFTNWDTATLSDVTISGNTATYGGGFRSNNSRSTLINVTAFGNAAEWGGGFSISGTVVMNNSIVAGSTRGGAIDLDFGYGRLTGGNNIVDDAANAGGLIHGLDGNLVGVDPLLGAPGDYGGPSRTFPLLPGSPAIDAGNTSLAVDGRGVALTTDQRGLPRVVGGRVDIGAFETSGFRLAVVSGDAQTALPGAAFMTLLQVRVTPVHAGDPVEQGKVAFMAPVSGASAVFWPADLVAVAGDTATVNATANANLGGPYTVTATTGGAAAPVSFSLLNRPAPMTSVSVVPSIPSPSYAQSVTFNVRLTPGYAGDPVPTGTLRFLLDGLDLGSAVSLAGGNAISTPTAPLSVGVHTIAVQYSGDAFYPARSDASNLVVDRAHLTVTADGRTKAYGDPVPALAATITGFVNGDTPAVVSGSPSLAITATQASGVGSYPITVGAGTLSATNYDFPNLVAGTLAIEKAPLTVAADARAGTYGHPIPPLTASYSGFVLGQDAGVLSGSLRLTTTANQASDVGSYAIEASGLSSSNYAIRFVPGVLTVVRAPLTVTADARTKTYGMPNLGLTASYSGFMLGQGAGVLGGALTFTTTATQASAVGAYPVTLSGLSSPNYAIEFVPGVLTVAPAPLAVTALGRTRAYGAPNPPFSASYSGFVLGEDATALGGRLILTTPALQDSDVGSYGIEASGLSSPNYAIRFVPATLTVTPAPLTIGADAASKTYGQPNPPLTASFRGFVLGQGADVLSGELSLATDATPASHVGSYAIRVSGLTSPNYRISYVPGTLAVTPAPLTVLADDKARLVGRPNPELTVRYEGFVNGDTAAHLTQRPSLSTAATPGSPAGTYPIEASGAVSPDYAIRHVAGTLSVAPAPVTVSRVSVQTVRSGRIRKSVIVVHFSDVLDPNAARSLGNYDLTTIPANKRQRAKAVKLAGASYDVTSRAVTLTTSKPLALNPPLLLRVIGAGLVDAWGRPLDGNRDGLPGGDALAVLRTKGVTLS